MKFSAMNNGIVRSFAVMVCAFVVLPAFAQEGSACLRDRDTFSTKVYDRDTIIVTVRDRSQYTVNMTESCVGLSMHSQLINLRPQRGGLQCLQRGDEVTFTMPGDTRVSGICLVDTVEDGPPPEG